MATVPSGVLWLTPLIKLPYSSKKLLKLKSRPISTLLKPKSRKSKPTGTTTTKTKLAWPWVLLKATCTNQPPCKEQLTSNGLPDGSPTTSLIRQCLRSLRSSTPWVATLRSATGKMNTSCVKSVQTTSFSSKTLSYTSTSAIKRRTTNICLTWITPMGQTQIPTVCIIFKHSKSCLKWVKNL